MSDPALLLVTVGLLSIGCQYLAWRLRVPAILPLLLTGIAIGPGLGLLDPDALFGDLLFPLVSLSVAIILFEGALTLKRDDLGGHGRMVRNLCTLGAVVTWAICTPVAHYALGLSWELAFLFGAIITVTGPTVIMPMLRTIRPSARIANILRWEGIVIDPIGALLAVLVYEYIVATQDALTHTLLTFGQTLAIGLITGAAGGQLLGLMLRHNWMPPYLRNIAVLTLMLGAFAGSDALAHESGLLTVTVMGIWLANMKNVDIEPILEFKETLTVLLISALFIILAARLDFGALLQLGWGAVIVLAVVLFVARPAAILISALGTDLTPKEKALLAWIAPRGIVAAAVSSLFALKLEEIGFSEANRLVPMVFLVIITTVVLQSLTAVRLTEWLGLRSRSPNGFLLFGANPFSRLIAADLIGKGYPVLIADTNWEAIREARMANIPVYYGNPISEHARRTLDLSGIGRVLVLSPYRQLNPLVTFHFEYTLGKGTVAGLSLGDTESRASHQMSEYYSSKLGLFSETATYGRLASLVARGATLKTTRLSDSFSLDDYQKTHGARALPLYAIDGKGKVHLYPLPKDLRPASDWQIVSLMTPEAQEDRPTREPEPVRS